MNNVFLVTRPIQYINVLNLPIKIYKDILLLTPNFNGWENILEIATNTPMWKNVVCIDSHKEIYRWIIHNRKSIKNFYTYSDNGISWHLLFSCLRKISFYVYEEGWASYSTYSLSLFKKILYFLINLDSNSGKYLGSSHFVKGIYVYDVKLHNALFPYNKRPLCEFKYSLNQVVLNISAISQFLYNSNGIFYNKNVLIYITSWNYNPKIDKILSENKNYVTILKPHPYFQRTQEIDNKFDYVIDGKYIAELIIADLLNQTKYLLIVHECSTVMLHFNDVGNNVCEINLKSQLSNTKEYFKIRTAIKQINSLIS